MQTRALLNLDKKYCKIFLRAKQLPVKGLIDNRCHSLEAVPERRAIHKLNAIFFLQKIRSECKYTRIIAHVDSSVYSKLTENAPIWGNRIKPLECAIYTCNRIRSNLEKLVEEKPHSIGKGKLSGRNIDRLTSAVRCAIKMRSQDKSI